MADTPTPKVAEMLAELDVALDLIYECTGSALLAGEKCKPGDNYLIYKLLCEAGTRVTAARGLATKPKAPRHG